MMEFRKFLSFPFVFIGNLLLFIGLIIRFGIVGAGDAFEGFTKVILSVRKELGE